MSTSFSTCCGPPKHLPMPMSALWRRSSSYISCASCAARARRSAGAPVHKCDGSQSAGGPQVSSGRPQARPTTGETNHRPTTDQPQTNHRPTTGQPQANHRRDLRTRHGRAAPGAAGCLQSGAAGAAHHQLDRDEAQRILAKVLLVGEREAAEEIDRRLRVVHLQDLPQLLVPAAERACACARTRGKGGGGGREVGSRSLHTTRGVRGRPRRQRWLCGGDGGQRGGDGAAGGGGAQANVPLRRLVGGKDVFEHRAQRAAVGAELTRDLHQPEARWQQLRVDRPLCRRRRGRR
eukprot:5324210-Prymnesium_polylepis.1